MHLITGCLNVTDRDVVSLVIYYISHNAQRHELTSRGLARVVSSVDSGSLLFILATYI